MFSSHPLGAALLDILSLPFHDYPLRPLLDTVRSPFFDLAFLGLERTDAKPLEIASRYGQVVQGIAQWEEAFQTLAQKPPSEEAEERSDEGGTVPRLPSGEQAHPPG